MNVRTTRVLRRILRRVQFLREERRKMSAWQITGFDDRLSSVLFLNTKAVSPVIRDPNEIVVKVCAASVNPLDVQMYGGYGNSLLQWMNFVSETRFPQETFDRFPVTLGRDFSGVVVDKGESVQKYKIGDCVWGVSAPHKPGTHSEYICVPQCNISKKPENVDHTEAASLPYVSLTTWSALCTFGGITSHNAQRKKVLILGGTGGVGTMAIQLLKSWGAYVVATCSANAVEWLNEVTGVDECIDYTSSSLSSYERTFDFVLDAATRDYSKSVDELAFRTLKKHCNSTYVTISSPLLTTMDKHGIFPGTFMSLFKAGCDTLTGISDGINVRWAFFYPNPNALETVRNLVESNRVKPVVEKVFSFEQLPIAYEKVKGGHARGKTVITMANG